MSGVLERLVPEDDSWGGAYADHVARYRFAMDYARGKRVLDAGTGQGYGAFMLAQGGARSVQAVDISDEVISAARERYKQSTVDFRVDDCQVLSRVDGPFDLVVNYENIEHVPEPEKLLEAVCRVIAPDGLYITSSPDRASTPPFVNGRPTNPHHVNEWYFDEFRDLLSGRFEHVEMYVQAKSHAYVRRGRGVRSLVTCLTYTNPLTRAMNSLLKRTRGRGLYGSLGDLAAPGPEDFPVIPAPIASLYGLPHVLVALCRGPKVRSSR